MTHELFEKHKKQIQGLVTKIKSKWNGPDSEELPSEAYLLFRKALATHDPYKAAFTTHLHFTVFGGLLSVCKKTNRYRMANRNIDALPEPKAEYTNFCRALEEREILATLSPDASELLHNLLNSTIEPATANRRISLERVYNTFGKRAGWTFKQVERAWSELGRAYAAMGAA